MRKLPAGHWLSVRDGKLATGAFWRPSYVPKHAFGAARGRSTRSTPSSRARCESMLVADVPLGAFVSGGVDSGLVAALATQASGRALDTFNLGFTGHDVGSEHVEAERVAKHIGSRHHCLMLAPDDVLPALDRWVGVFDEPFGDQAALPTMLLAEYARRTVTVVLTGEGADEVFGGYGNYVKRLREERITGVLGARGSPLPWLAAPAAAAPRARPHREGDGRAARAPLRDDPQHLRRAAARANISPTRSPPRRTARIADRAEAFYDECDSPAYLDHLLDIDARLWLPDDLLAKVDRATMAFSLEARVPYLDHELLRLVRAARSRAEGARRHAQAAAEALAERYLPHDIVHRPKQGFMMPLERWLANELKPDIAVGARARRGSRGAG